MTRKQQHFLSLVGMLLLLLKNFNVFSQGFLVPKNIDVAGITLKISEQAQRIIKREIDEILEHADAFKQSLLRACIYLPQIEKILVKNKVPKEYKYLVIQLSDINPLKEEGIWQIKKEDMGMMGLTMTDEYDDRLHLLKSTTAIANRLYRSNQLYSNNWLVNILVLSMGEAKTKRFILNNAEKMSLKAQTIKINQDAHNFIFTFLAIKILYQNKLKDTPKTFKIISIKNPNLNKLAKKYKVSLARLRKYNPWIKNTNAKLHSSKSFDVLIPQFEPMVSTSKKTYYQQEDKTNHLLPPPQSIIADVNTKPSPVISRLAPEATVPSAKFHIVQKGENIYDIARKYDIKYKQLRNINKVSTKMPSLFVGQKIFLKQPSKEFQLSKYFYHVVINNQTLFQIAKMYNVRTEDIKSWNNLRTETLFENQELKIKKDNLHKRLQSSSGLPKK